VPLTNCRLPEELVVKSLGDSYIFQPFPPSNIKPSPGPGSAMCIEFTFIMSALFRLRPVVESRPVMLTSPFIVTYPVIVSPVL